MCKCTHMRLTAQSVNLQEITQNYNKLPPNSYPRTLPHFPSAPLQAGHWRRDSNHSKSHVNNANKELMLMPLLISVNYCLILTLEGPLSHPCHTRHVVSWPGRKSHLMPRGGSLPLKLWRCQPPEARTRTPHSVLLDTTSSRPLDT